jgi:hypothetical protein
VRTTNWPKNKKIGDIYANSTGAKWKWTGKAWVSLRESEIVYLPGAVGPTGPGVTQSGFTYQFSHSSMDPVDNMDYYIGNISDSPAQSSNSIASKRIKSLTSGKVKQVSIMTQISGEVGSDDEQTFILRNYTSDESVVITSNYINNSNSKLDNYLLDTPLEVSIGDELDIIWRVNVFEVTPTGVRHNFNIFLS